MSIIADIDQAIAIIEDNRRVELERISQKFDDDIAALRRSKEILSLQAKSNGAVSSIPKPVISDESHVKQQWPGIRPAMKQLIAGYKETFTIENLMSDFQSFSETPTIDRNSVSSELWRMTKEDELTLVRKGRPNTYTRGPSFTDGKKGFFS